MRQVDSAVSELRLEGNFAEFSPEEVFAHWTTPDLLTQFWPTVASVDPRVGGYYRFEWPTQGWFVHGNYTAFDPGRKLGFSWTWNFDVDGYEPLQVVMTFEDTTGGCRMTIHHWPFEDTEEGQKARADTAGGWVHFCDRLRALRSSVGNSPRVSGPVSSHSDH